MKPLEGVKILEFSTMITASFAAMMMAEQGAEVIKVEPTEAGDPMRYIGVNKGGISSLFANCNRGKKSIRVDLKSEDGQALVQRLAAKVDIVIHNFRPGVMNKLNLGSEALRKNNPRLIYIAISGFGPTGPLGDAPAYDPVIQAHAGLTAAQGMEEPAFIRNLICDKITAYTACQAATSALYMREKTGEGQHVDLSMLDAGLFFIFPDGFMNHTLLDEDVVPQPLLSDLLYELTVTKDGGLTISASTDKQRAGVMKALGREDLMADERFSSLEKLITNIDAYKAELADSFLQFTTEEMMEKLSANDVPHAKCMTRDEVLAQPQLAANGSVVEVEHPLMGKMRVLKTPARFGGESEATASHAPDHGEHTDLVLSELGLSSEDIAELKEKQVVV